METAILILICLCAALLIAVLALLLRPGNDRLRQDLANSQAQLRQEITRNVQTSVSALGGMIGDNQRQAAEQQERRWWKAQS